jgi:hypothetical protein
VVGDAALLEAAPADDWDDDSDDWDDDEDEDDEDDRPAASGSVAEPWKEQPASAATVSAAAADRRTLRERVRDMARQ